MITYAEYREMTFWSILEQISKTGNQSDCWNYMCALRGPDVDNLPLKRLFTAFIRGYVIAVEYVGIESFEHLLENKARINELHNCEVNTHFLNHVRYGILAISKIAEGDLNKICNTLLMLCTELDRDEKDKDKLNKLTKRIAQIVRKAMEESE